MPVTIITEEMDKAKDYGKYTSLKLSSSQFAWLSKHQAFLLFSVNYACILMIFLHNIIGQIVPQAGLVGQSHQQIHTSSCCSQPYPGRKGKV